MGKRPLSSSILGQSVLPLPGQPGFMLRSRVWCGFLWELTLFVFLLGGMALPDANLYHMTYTLTRVLGWALSNSGCRWSRLFPGFRWTLPWCQTDLPTLVLTHPMVGGNLACLFQSVPGFLHCSKPFPAYPHSWKSCLQSWPTFL